MDLTRACPLGRQQLSTPEQLALSGVTKHALRELVARGELVRVARGVYSPGPLPPRREHALSGGQLDPAYVAHVRAALLAGPAGAAAGGRTAALLWGFDLAVEPADVELALPDGGRAPEGRVGVRHARLDVVRRRVLGLDPLPMTSAVQTVVHCALQLPLAEAVVVADSALRSGKVTLEQLHSEVHAMRRRPGGRRLRKVVDLADPACGSVLESLTRVLLVEAGLPRPSSQVVLRDGTKLIGRVDFVWRELRVVLECDGRRWHDPEDARDRDRRRDNALTLTNYRVLRYTWADVVHDSARVVAEVKRALALAA